MSEVMPENVYREESQSFAWAKEQLAGVMREDDPRYHVESQLVMLIYLDCMAMESRDQGVTYFHWPSEFEPQSWSWLI